MVDSALFCFSVYYLNESYSHHAIMLCISRSCSASTACPTYPLSCFGATAPYSLPTHLFLISSSSASVLIKPLLLGVRFSAGLSSLQHLCSMFSCFVCSNACQNVCSEPHVCHTELVMVSSGPFCLKLLFHYLCV